MEVAGREMVRMSLATQSYMRDLNVVLTESFKSIQRRLSLTPFGGISGVLDADLPSCRDKTASMQMYHLSTRLVNAIIFCTVEQG